MTSPYWCPPSKLCLLLFRITECGKRPVVEEGGMGVKGNWGGGGASIFFHGVVLFRALDQLQPKPSPLLIEAVVWPCVWRFLFIQTWSGMGLLFDRWSHDNQPQWASLDKPIRFTFHVYILIMFRVFFPLEGFSHVLPRYGQFNNDDMLDWARPCHNVWSLLSMHDVIWKVKRFF